MTTTKQIADTIWAQMGGQMFAVMVGVHFFTARPTGIVIPFKAKAKEGLNRVVITRPFPEQIASTYSARVAGPQGITLLDAAECWIYQHGLRHMGEIELARGLVGLHGMTS